MRLVIHALLLTTLALSACVYRPDIKQGNYLKPDMIAQVKAGMSEAQVRFVMGPPMIVDPFHTDRWDYVYYDNPSTLSKNHAIVREHVVVRFKGGKVSSVEELLPVQDKNG